jgi:hypothetical protein
MVSDVAADAQDAIFEAAVQSVCDWATQLTENYQELADPEVVAAWPVGCALVTNGVLAMANSSAGLAPEAIAQLCDDVLAFIGVRIVEIVEGEVAA